ncbi:MAG: sodium:solute symporter family protein [Thermoprotei archaeon]|nr:MAG: sodium:solute symporter family protein [Thermoprotei archaeon]
MEPAAIASSIIFTVLGITIVIGVLAYRLGIKVLRADTYIVAGRALGFIVTFLNMAAVIYSGFAFLGAAGWAYSYGAPVLYIWVYGALAYTFAFFFAPRIWSVAKGRNLLTQADFFLWRYNSKLLMTLVALVGILFNIPYIQLQILTVRYVLDLSTYGALPSLHLAVLSFLLVVLYVFLGGMVSVAIANVFLGAIMLGAMLGGSLAIIGHYFGGLEGLFRAVAEVSPQHLAFPGAAGIHPVQWFITAAVGCGLGFWVWPQLAQMVFPARSPRVLRRSVVMTSWYHVLGIIWASLTGLAAVALGIKLAAADQAFIFLIDKTFGPAALGLIGAAGMAAALSSGAGILLTQASLCARNLYQQLVKPTASDRELVLVTRISVIVFAAIGAILAYVAPAQLVYLLLVGYAGITQMFPGWVLGSIWKWITREGVLAGLVVGETVVVLTTFVWSNPLGIHSIVWGLIFNLPLALLISKLTYREAKAPQG